MRLCSGFVAVFEKVRKVFGQLLEAMTLLLGSGRRSLLHSAKNGGVGVFTLERCSQHLILGQQTAPSQPVVGVDVGSFRSQRYLSSSLSSKVITLSDAEAVEKMAQQKSVVYFTAVSCHPVCV